MNAMRVMIVLALTMGILPRPSKGQEGTRDSLYYRELTSSVTVMSTTQGEIRVTNEHDALIGYVALTPDSAHAWYEALSLTMLTPAGRIAPETTEALKEPFVLRIDSTGQARTLQAPAFPEEFEELTDLTRQFDDFFMPLPSSSMTVGLAWSDTFTVTDEPNEAGETYEARRVGRYAVVGDTVIDSTPTFVVRSESDLRSESSGPLEGSPGVQVTTVTQGTETGYFFVRKDDSQLVRRTRSATLQGTIRYLSSQGEVSLDLTFSYESQADRAPNSGGPASHQLLRLTGWVNAAPR